MLTAPPRPAPLRPAPPLQDDLAPLREAPPPAGGRGGSWLTEQNVRPLNAEFEAAGGGGGGSRRGGAHDALTVATVNRYTYALGQVEVGGDSCALCAQV